MKFIEIIKTIISEQNETSFGGFKRGDVLRAKRDKDGGDYELVVLSIEPNRVEGKVSVKSLDGRGKYKNKVLNGGEQHEVDLRQKSYIVGNPELGKFTNIKKISTGGTGSSSSTSTSTSGTGRDPAMTSGKASKTGVDYGPATTAVKGATADEKAMMNRGKAVKSEFN